MLDHFDHVHASPPCQQYSRAKTKGVRDLFSADAISEKALAIRYFSTAAYSIENPCGGKYTLEKRGILDDLPRYLITYCKFESPLHPYRKPTSIWTNLSVQFPLPCSKAARCDFFLAGDGKHHPKSAQRGTQNNYIDASNGLHQLHSMPPNLCRIIATAASALQH